MIFLIKIIKLKHKHPFGEQGMICSFLFISLNTRNIHILSLSFDEVNEGETKASVALAAMNQCKRMKEEYQLNVC